MKRYFDYTDKEKLSLSHEDFQHSITLEAMWRGIKPPITLSEALVRTEYRGYQIPPESTVVFEIVKESSYSNSPSGMAYLDRSKAQAAIDGLVGIENDGYGATAKKKIAPSGFVIQETRISLRDAKGFQSKLDEFLQDNTEFETVAQECCEDFSKVRQADYNTRVTAEKRAEYLRLAKGNEEVAKSFWNKTERTEWPLPVPAADEALPAEAWGAAV